MENNIVSSIFDDPAIEQPIPYASLGQRLANFFIDFIVFSISIRVIYFIIAFSMAIAGADREYIVELLSDPFLRTGFFLLIFPLTWTVIESASRGRSLGKVITRTVVVKTDNSRLTFKDVFIRSLCRLIPFEPISIFFNLENAMWHDKGSNTMVIKKDHKTY